MPHRILALGAHPDDIEIFMGGALLAWRRQGARLVSVIATDGARGGTGDPAELARQRAGEAKAAANLLGAKLHMLGFADGDLMADAALIAAIGRTIAATAPDLVVTHSPNDYHADHRALAAAARQATGFGVPLLYCDSLMGTGFVPTHYVDITASMPDKCLAIRCHQSQEPERFVALAHRQNGYRAGQCGQPEGSCAEAYRFEAIYPFGDIRDLLPPAPPLRPVPSRQAATTAARPSE